MDVVVGRHRVGEGAGCSIGGSGEPRKRRRTEERRGMTADLGTTLKRRVYLEAALKLKAEFCEDIVGEEWNGEGNGEWRAGFI
jgi:hypothetical protein